MTVQVREGSAWPTDSFAHSNGAHCEYGGEYAASSCGPMTMSVGPQATQAVHPVACRGRPRASSIEVATSHPIHMVLQ